MKSYCLAFLGILILLYSFHGQTFAENMSASQPIIVYIKQKVIVHKEQYNLGDIASKIQNASQEVQDKINLVSLGKSPLPGKAKKIQKNYILAKMRQAGYQVIVSLPKQASITRSAFKIPASSLKNALISEIKKRYQDHEKVEIKIIRALSSVMIPKGKVSFEVYSPKMQQNLGGIMTWNLVLFVDEKQICVLPIQVNLHVIDKVWIAKHVILRRQIITKNDLLQIKKEISSERIGYKSKLSDFVGKEARQTIALSSVLSKNFLDEPLLIKKGKVVTLVYQGKRLYFSNQVKALESGHKNDTIKVETLNGKRVVFAIVQSEQQVKVAL